MRKKILKSAFIFTMIAVLVLFFMPSMVFAVEEPENLTLTVDTAPAGQETKFNVSAENAEGLHASILIFDEWAEGEEGGPVGDPIIIGIGQVDSDSWSETASHVFGEAGDYYATFVLDTTAEPDGDMWSTDFEVFTIMPATLDIDTAPAGQETKFHIYTAGTEGSWLHLAIWEEEDWLAEDWEATVAEFSIDPIPSSPYEETFGLVLSKGNYVARFFGLGSPTDLPFDEVHMFTIVAPPPPPVPAPVYPIDQKPLESYDTTTTGGCTFFYNRILGRAPDPEGMANWVAAVDAGIVSCSDMAYLFIFSNECQAQISGYSNEEFVTFLYQSLFNREPDQEGFAAWISALEGTMSREEVVRRFTDSPEFKAICSHFGL